MAVPVGIDGSETGKALCRRLCGIMELLCRRIGFAPFSCAGTFRKTRRQNVARLFSGCGSEGRICCSYLISAHQRQKGRITVIIVNEELGY